MRFFKKLHYLGSILLEPLMNEDGFLGGLFGGSGGGGASSSSSNEKTVSTLSPEQQQLWGSLAPYLQGQLGQMPQYTAGLWNQVPSTLMQQLTTNKLPSTFLTQDRDIIDKQAQSMIKGVQALPGLPAGLGAAQIGGIQQGQLGAQSNLIAKGQQAAAAQQQQAIAQALQLMGMPGPNQEAINNILNALGLPTTTQQKSSTSQGANPFMSALGGGLGGAAAGGITGLIGDLF